MRYIASLRDVKSGQRFALNGVEHLCLFNFKGVVFTSRDVLTYNPLIIDSDKEVSVYILHTGNHSNSEGVDLSLEGTWLLDMSTC